MRLPDSLPRLQQDLGNQAMIQLHEAGVIQPKLRISQPGDADEEEADRIADHIVSNDRASVVPLVPSRRSASRTSSVHRKCSCSGGAKCAKCEEEVEEGKGIHRKAESVSKAPTPAPDSFLKGLGSGRALDPPLRRSMELRLQQDFSAVRIHDDSGAAQSAKAINAQAFTAGSDIYFGSGSFAPESHEGRRLLAHELVHVVQQNKSKPSTASSAGATRIARKAENPVVAPAGPPGCTLDQHRQIVPAVSLALQWLDKSMAALSRFIAAPADKANKATADSLQLHFRAADPATAQRVLTRLSLLRNDISSSRGRKEITTECHAAADSKCHDAGAYVTGDTNQLVFCPPFFGADPNWQTKTIIHEMSHSIFPSGTAPLGVAHITDRAYQSDRNLSRLSTAEALTNADSIALFVQEIGTGKAQRSTAPSDDVPDNCREIEQPLRDAIAKAQRWNYNADTDVVNHATPAMIQQSLGRDTPQNRSAAQDFYSKADKGFNNSFKFECEKECKARTAWGEDHGNKLKGLGIGAALGAGLGALGGFLFGFGALLGAGVGLVIGGLIGVIAGAITSKGPVIHVCPTWKAQANSPAGIESILAAAYEALGNSTTDSLKYARLAAAIQAFHPAAATLDEIDKDVLRRRLLIVQRRLALLHGQYNASSDIFARSIANERMSEADKRARRELKNATRADLASPELWGGNFAGRMIRKIVTVSGSDTSATLSANLQLTYKALSDADGQKRAAIDIPRIETVIRDVWNVKIAHGEYAGVEFRLNPTVTFLPRGQKRSENAFLITVRGPDKEPSTGDGVHGEISLAAAHLEGARVIVVAHELAHAFGFVDTYLTEELKQKGGGKTQRMAVGRTDLAGRADLLGMIDPVNLDKALKKGAITPAESARQRGPVHIWEEEASIVLRTLGVQPPGPRRPSPDDDDFDPQLELDRIKNEGEGKLADIRARRKRVDDAIESVNMAEEIIKLEEEEKSLKAQIAAPAPPKP
jgi:hypothetical protein